MNQNNPYKIDFGNDKDGEEWQVINDNVMGGLSIGSAELKSLSRFRFY